MICSKVKSLSSAGNAEVTVVWLTLLLPRQNFFLLSSVLSEWGWMQRRLIVFVMIIILN